MRHAAHVRKLESLRRRREELRDSQRQAADDLVDAAARAEEAGMTVTEICRLAGVSREGLYKMRRARG